MSHLLRHPSLVPLARWSVTLGAALILGALSAAMFADSIGLLDVVVTLLYSIVFLIGWPILAGVWFEGMVMSSGRGIRYLGVLRDEQLGPDDVWGVEASTTGDAVAIGIRDDARAVAAWQVTDPRVGDPDSAARVLREWLRQGRGSGGLSLTPGAWASILLLAWVIWLTVSNLVS